MSAGADVKPPRPVANEGLGITLRILSTLAFAAMGLCVKALGGSVPLGQVVFFRSAVALVPLVLFLWWRGEWPRGLATARPLGHVGRCLMGATAMFTSFAAIRLLPLAEATMLSYLTPVMLVLLALIWRMWAQFRQRTIQPAVARVDRAWDGVEDRADAVRDRAAARAAQTRGRFTGWMDTWRGKPRR